MPSVYMTDNGPTGLPGVYVRNRFTNNGRASSRGIMALVAEIPELEPATVYEATTEDALKALAPTSSVLAQIAKVAFNPSVSDRIPGRPSGVLLLSATPSTAPSLALQDGTPKGSIDLASKAYGKPGNRTRVTKFAANAVDATLFDITVVRDNRSEPYTSVGSGAVLTLNYTGEDADTMTLGYTVANGVRVAWGIAAAAIGTVDVSDIPFDGAISANPSTVPASGQTFTVTITGINKADGTPLVEALSWAEGETDELTTDGLFSSVTSIVAAESGSATPTFALSGYSFDLDESDYATVGLAADYIGSHPSFTVTVSPSAKAYPLDELDFLTATTIADANASIRADTKAILDALANSQLVTATRASGADRPPAVLTSTQWLTGGSNGSTGDDDWDACLTTLETEDCNVVWVASESATVHTLLDTHITYMLGKGANERQGFAGAAASTSFTALKARAAALDSYRVQLCTDEIQVPDPNGVATWLSPAYQALQWAAARAAAPVVGRSLTNTRPNVINYRRAATANDPELLIKAGLCFYGRDHLGRPSIIREVTTHLETNDPTRSDPASVQSWMMTNRHVRDRFRTTVGLSNVEITDKEAASIVKGALEEATDPQRLNYAKSFVPGSVQVTDTGEALVASGTIHPKVTRLFVGWEPSITTTTTLAFAA